MGIRALACALPLIACASAAAAAAPRELTRSDKWDVNYDEDSCSLYGAFGTGAQRIVMRMQWFSDGAVFDLTLFGKMFGSETPSGSMTIDFGPKADPHAQTVTYGNAGQLPLVIVSNIRIDDFHQAKGDSSEPTAIDPAYPATVDWLDLGIRGRTVRLRLHRMGAAMAAVSGCKRNLIARWGYDPAAVAAQARSLHPTTDPATWLRSDDYPLSATLRGENGIIHFRLDVDETGAVKGCHVLMKFKNEAFDKVTCELLSKRARFAPALAADGRPTRSFYVNAVHWIMR